MKVVSFNLHLGGKKGDGNAWQHLIRDFAPDIVCAQESADPHSYPIDTGAIPEDRRVWKCAPDRNNWGSAIVAMSHKHEEIEVDGFLGWVAGARLPDVEIGGTSGPLTIFSIHAPSPGPYTAQVDKILDAIAAKWDKGPLIIAGDFNVTTAKRSPTEPYPNSKQELALLARLREEFGLRNAWQALHPGQELPQTLRWNNRPDVPYHCDGIFVDARHLPHLVSAEVVASGYWGSASDHNSIVVEFR